MASKVLIALMLLAIMGTAVAVAPIIIFMGGMVVGGFISWFFTERKLNEYEELVSEYQNKLTSNNIVNSMFTEYYLRELWMRDQHITMLARDISEHTKNYAWSLAKYTALKTLDAELKNNTFWYNAKNLAKVKSREAVESYYNNVTRNIIEMNNETLHVLYYVLNYTWNNIKIGRISGNLSGYAELCGNRDSLKYYVCDLGSECRYNTYSFPHTINRLAWTFQVENNLTTINVWQSYFDSGYITDDYNGCWRTLNARIDTVYYNNSLIYKRAEYLTAIERLQSSKNSVLANIDAYVDGISQEYLNNWSISSLMDPYILASQMNYDFSQTGYYGYAGAELTLLGLRTVGLNKTIKIALNDSNSSILEGWLFTDWQGTLQVNQTYYANPSYLWFFVDDTGLYDIRGYNFTVLDIRDYTNRSLQNVTLIKYVDHSGNISELYEELGKIRQLYEEYLDTLAIGGGGSGGSGGNSGGFTNFLNGLRDWFNSLKTEEKLIVLGLGAVGVYALLRRK